jgi:hypothetical protein
MRILRALVVCPLIPLLGIAVLGIELGYRSIASLGEYVLAWAVVMYPLVAAVTLGAHAFTRFLGVTSSWYFGVGGFLVGFLLALAYFGPHQPVGGGSSGGSPVFPTALLCGATGVLASAALLAYWRLVLGARAA